MNNKNTQHDGCGIRTNPFRAWWLAIRPKTLTGAAFPVWVATALAFSDQQMEPFAALMCLLFALGMQVAANLINDLFDFMKGSDREDRLGPKRACAQGWITPACMKIGIGIVLVASCLAGGILFFHCRNELPYQGWELIATGITCVIFAFLYTTVLSYHGWGDLLVLVFFGLVPVCGTYYVQTYSVSSHAVALSLVSGLVIDTLLVVNNYRDREQDALSGKRTLVVRWGEPFGRYLYLGVGVAAWLVCVLWLVPSGKLTPFSCIWAPTAYLWLHVLTWRKMVQIGYGEKLNSILGETSRNMLFMGLLLSIALMTEGC